LAHNYWDGYLQNLVLERPEDHFSYDRKIDFKDRRDFTNIVDLITQFEERHLEWCKIHRSLLKLVILVDYSCNFAKDKKKWPELYKMELRREENENMPKMSPLIPTKMASKTQGFDIKLARVWNPEDENDFFHIVFDAPMILRSAMAGGRVQDDLEQKRRNVNDFVKFLQKMLKTKHVTEQVEIICFNDGSTTDQNPSLYKAIQKHLEHQEDELPRF
jgi:hypothetical protein